VFKKVGFQHREGWMKLGPEERSVRFWYVSTGGPGWIQDSMPSYFLDSLRVRYRIFYVISGADEILYRKKTYRWVAVAPPWITSIGFLIKIELFELPH